MSRRPQRVPRGDRATHAPAHAQQVAAHEPLHAASQHEHCVILYQDTDHLVDAIGAWAEAGLHRGEGVITILRSELGDRVRTHLRARGIDVKGFEATGQLRLLDADATLRLFMVRGQPQPNLFTNVVAPLVESVAAASPAGEVRAWGEMVNLLWRRAQGAAAVALEALWNDFIATTGVRLFCSYEVDPFDALQFLKVRSIASSHGRMLATEDDARFAAAVDAAFQEVYGPEAAAVRTLLGGAPPGLPTPLHHLLALHELVPSFGELVAARAGQLYRGGA